MSNIDIIMTHVGNGVKVSGSNSEYSSQMTNKDNIVVPVLIPAGQDEVVITSFYANVQL